MYPNQPPQQPAPQKAKAVPIISTFAPEPCPGCGIMKFKFLKKDQTGYYYSNTNAHFGDFHNCPGSTVSQIPQQQAPALPNPAQGIPTAQFQTPAVGYTEHQINQAQETIGDMGLKTEHKTRSEEILEDTAFIRVHLEQMEVWEGVIRENNSLITMILSKIKPILTNGQHTMRVVEELKAAVEKLVLFESLDIDGDKPPVNKKKK